MKLLKLGPKVFNFGIFKVALFLLLPQLFLELFVLLFHILEILLSSGEVSFTLLQVTAILLTILLLLL